jgi:hypothetical protein
VEEAILLFRVIVPIPSFSLLMLEHRQENKLSARHAVEEAMTAALIRVCNSCKVPFLKEEGCNHMRCESCGNEQCFVCSINVTGYAHFGNGPGMCPLELNSSGTEERQCADVASAQERAVRQNLDKQGGWKEAVIIVDANLVGEAARLQQARVRQEREAQEAIARQQLAERLLAEEVARLRLWNLVMQCTATGRPGKAAARRKRRKEEQEEREKQERKRERNRRRRARVRERKRREAQEAQQNRNRKRRRSRRNR